MESLFSRRGRRGDADQVPEPFGKVGVGRGQNADDAENIYVYSVTEREILEREGLFLGENGSKRREDFSFVRLAALTEQG
jgi:hypothetical protein